MEATAEPARATPTESARPADPHAPPNTGEEVLGSAAVARGTAQGHPGRHSAPPARMFALQTMAGNRAVARMLQRDTPQSSDLPGSIPGNATPQEKARHIIDEALRDFTQ